MTDEVRRGPAVAARVAADPFWSAVRRRHPDLDIVLLPPEGPAPERPAREAGEPPELDEPAAAELAAVEAEWLWRELVGDHEPDDRASRWLREGGGVVRRETTLRARDADPVAAVAAVERAGATLTDQGWRVVAPPDGMPRVLAARETEVQLVFAPADAVLMLRVRGGRVRLGEAPA
ncbi:hypothetical protein GCM10027062_40910 [Nocardioides hungaricus]